jgi:hypothetical protein
MFVGIDCSREQCRYREGDSPELALAPQALKDIPENAL